MLWARLGATSFGGPAAHIAMLHDEVVVTRKWVSEKRFLHALNYCMVLPGPEAQQLVTYIGWLLHGVRGGVLAGTLFVLPSLALLIVISGLYMVFGTTPVVASVFDVLKPVVIAIIIHAMFRIGSRALNHPVLWGIAGISTAVMVFSGALFPVILVFAAVVGAVGGRMNPQVFASRTRDSTASESDNVAVIGDSTPIPLHATISRIRLLRTVIVCAIAWAVPIGVLWATVGATNPLFSMALFFSGAAFLTFGGAYAVLPYVFNGAVSAGWATPAQMIDGLALGETTPGPLIMFVSFVGFVAGFSGEFFGPGSSWVSATVAAVVVTWFTFLPSFFFILAGGPYVEASRSRIAFTAPLTAINAAIVGVIGSLAITFAGSVLFPAGEPLNLFGFVVTAATVFVLFRWRRSFLEVIAGGIGLGLLVALGATLLGA